MYYVVLFVFVTITFNIDVVINEIVINQIGINHGRRLLGFHALSSIK